MRKTIATLIAVLFCGFISAAFIVIAPEKVFAAATEPLSFTYTVKIHEDMPYFIARLDMWSLPESSARNLYEYEASITIMYEDGSVLQQIDNLEISYRTDSRWIRIDPENPANLHFDDYNQDGFLDMAVRHIPGNSRMNDPHYFWLWDTEQEQFQSSYELETLSHASSVSLTHDGNIRTSLRFALGHYILETHMFVDGTLIPYITRERKPFQVGEDSTYKIIITDHINETKSMMLEPF